MIVNVSAMSTVEDLREARTLLHSRGWRRGKRTSEESHVGPLDILEALSVVTHEYVNKAMWGPHYEAAKVALVDAIATAGPADKLNPGKALIGFNDGPTRMAADVIHLFDDAIRKLAVTTDNGSNHD